ncbi:MAG: amino acid adenylation domain-containing protein [Clostridiaceae bacterium]|nr:amino acid adenylation domain-containing protein [Clostridiaceae bacterium]
MITNVLEYLEDTVQRVPEKLAFADEEVQLTFREFYDRMQKVASGLCRLGADREPVVIYMKKSPDTLAAFFGVIGAGCIYVPIDEEMPRRRMELILKNTQARYLVYDESTQDQVQRLGFTGEAISYRSCLEGGTDAQRLRAIREQSQDMDPIYILFTSGSTGMPKGVVGHHRGVIDYIESLSEVLGLSEDSVFGSQTPLYLDACMKEVYPTLKYGATTWLIPKERFMTPVKLVEFLNAHRINTICWVVSALTMISAFGTFDIVRPEYLHTVAFGSEVFPIRQFNLWKQTLPEAKFFNLYGPTEATGMSCFYPAERQFADGEVIPIGKPFRNTRILLLDQNGKEVPFGKEGEICIRGTCLTHGYYNNPEKTAEVFTQNPLNPNFSDRIYHTGDLGKYNADGDLVFLSRKDHQIKHMGHRIELGEIEADAALLGGVKACCCIYIRESGKIVLFYVGDIDKKSLTAALKERLPRYMLPNAILSVDSLAMLPNGKIDRIKMQEIYLSQRKKRRSQNK